MSKDPKEFLKSARKLARDLGQDPERVKGYTVDQSQLTSDCWLVQIRGLEACRDCEHWNKKECGGKRIIKQILVGLYPPEGIGRPINNLKVNFLDFD